MSITDFILGPRCEKHPEERKHGIVGCETCFGEHAREFNKQEKEERIEEYAEAFLRALRRFEKEKG